MPTYGPGWGRSRAGGQRNLRGETRNYHWALGKPSPCRGKVHSAGRAGEEWKGLHSASSKSGPPACTAHTTLPRAETALKQSLPPLEMMLLRNTTSDKPPTGNRLQHPLWLSVKGAGVGSGVVFWDNGSRCFHHPQWGKMVPGARRESSCCCFG